MSRRIRMPLVQNINPNGRATVRLPLGFTYNRLFIFTRGNILTTMLSNIVLKLNGSERIRWLTQAQLLARNLFHAGQTSTTALTLDFLNRQAKSLEAQTLGTYAATQEAGVQDLTLEFDIGTYTISGASTIEIWADVDPPSANRLILRNRYFQKVLAGAVEEQIIVPYGQNGEQLQRIYIFGTLANIDFVRIRREGSDEYEDVRVTDAEYIQRDYGKQPQAGLLCVDFIENNIVSDALNTAILIKGDGKATPVQNLDIRLRTNAGGTFNIYTEAITNNDRA
jgi:hypothetical protein